MYKIVLYMSFKAVEKHNQNILDKLLEKRGVYKCHKCERRLWYEAFRPLNMGKLTQVDGIS